MKNTEKLILIILISSISYLGIFEGCIQAQSRDNDYLGFFIPSPKRKQVELAFKQYHNLMVIPIFINDSDTLNFVLDTGVGHTLITDPDLMDELELDCIRQVDIAGAGGNKVLKACITNVESMWIHKKIGSIKHNLLVLEEDVLHLSQYAGVKIHGLIGYDLFSRFVVKINYVKKILTFTVPERFNFKPKKYEVFPMTIEYMKPYIQAEAIFEENTSAPVKLIMDTGAGHSLSLEAGSHPNIKVPNKRIKAQIGMALGGEIHGSIGRITEFKMGSFTLPKVITSFPDSASLPIFKGLAKRQGNLGSGVLKRFHLTFDYPHERVLLKPNRRFKEPFEFNTSGVEVLASGPNYSIYKVSNVRKSSPAFQAGLREGDQIIGVDREFLGSLNLNKIYKLLNKKAGRKTKVFFVRDSIVEVAEFVLKDPL